MTRQNWSISSRVKRGFQGAEAVNVRVRQEETVIDALGFALAFISIVVGGILVDYAVSGVGPAESMTLVAGALLLSIGFVGVLLVGKSWWQWRRILKGGDDSSF